METKSNIKRVLLVNSLRFGGGEKIASLLSSKTRTSLYVMSDENDIEVDSELLQKDLVERGNMFFKLFKAAVALKKIVKKQGINIVQSHLINSNLVNCISIMLGSPHKAEIVHHGMFSQRNNEGVKGFVLKFLMKRFYPYSQRNIFVSSSCMKDYQVHIKKLNAPEVIFNPFDIDDILLKSQSAILDYSDYYIAVGRLEAVKKYDVLIRAFLLYVQSGGKRKLLIMGKGLLRNELTCLVNDLGLQEHIIFLGAMANPYGYIKNAEALLQVSESETFSNTVAEAIILKTPVISTRSGGPDELLNYPEKSIVCGIQKCKYGILLDVNDEKAVGHALTMDLSIEDNTDFCNTVSMNTVIKKYMEIS